MAAEDLSTQSGEGNKMVLPEDDPSFSDYDLLVLDQDPAWQRMVRLAFKHVEQLEEDGRNR